MISETRLRTAYFFCLAAILLVFMHLFLPNMGGTMAMPFEYLVWLGIFTIILLAVFQALRAGELVLPTFRLYVFGFAALLLASSVFNPILNPQLFAIEALRFVALIVLWLALHQFPLEGRDRERLLLLIFASGAIEAVIGMLQFHGIPTVIPLLPPPPPRREASGGVSAEEPLCVVDGAGAGRVAAPGHDRNLPGAATVRARRVFRFRRPDGRGSDAGGVENGIARLRRGRGRAAGGAIFPLPAGKAVTCWRGAPCCWPAWRTVSRRSAANGRWRRIRRRCSRTRESSNVRRLLMYETSFEMFKEQAAGRPRLRQLRRLVRVLPGGCHRGATALPAGGGFRLHLPSA